jgi:hypothetical protein
MPSAAGNRGSKYIPRPYHSSSVQLVPGTEGAGGFTIARDIDPSEGSVEFGGGTRQR